MLCFRLKQSGGTKSCGADEKEKKNKVNDFRNINSHSRSRVEVQSLNGL